MVLSIVAACGSATKRLLPDDQANVDLPAPGDDRVLLVGHGAAIELAQPTSVARIGKAAGPNAKPWDLITASMRSGSLANAFVTARSGATPIVRPPVGHTLADAGIGQVRPGPDGDWQVATEGVVFPFVDLPMFAVSHSSAEEILPIEIVPSIWFNDGPFPGAIDTMLTIVGPLDEPLAPTEVSAPDQTVVASDLSGTPRWLENGYTHDGVAWRQRIYWSPDGRFIVRYQAPADRTHEIELLRTAAERIVPEIRLAAPTSHP